MPRNLDDFELERTPHTPPDGPQPSPRAPAAAAEEPEMRPVGPDLEPPEGRDRGRGGRLLPTFLAVLALVAFAVLGILYLVFRQPSKPQPVQAQAPVTAPARPASSASPAERGPVPPLEQSDDLVRSVAAGLSSRPELASWLAQRELVRTLTAVVVNVVDGETPRPHLGFLAPAQRFRAKGGRGRRIVADPAGFAGYDRFADAVASVDSGAAVVTYRRLEPLFEAAYRELGHPEGGFRQAVDRGIAALLAAPVPPADAELVPHAIGFRYADPRLEGLTPAQKQFLRMGPRNVKLVQEKLRELRAALGSAEAPAGPPSDRAR